MEDLCIDRMTLLHFHLELLLIEAVRLTLTQESLCAYISHPQSAFTHNYSISEIYILHILLACDLVSLMLYSNDPASVVSTSRMFLSFELQMHPLQYYSS